MDLPCFRVASGIIAAGSTSFLAGVSLHYEIDCSHGKLMVNDGIEHELNMILSRD